MRLPLLAPLPSADAMRAADAEADVRGLSPVALVESAGRASARVVRQAFPTEVRGHVLVVCGKGGNGADGLALARTLAAHGVTVDVRLASPRADLAPHAAYHLALLEAMMPDLPGSVTVRSAEGDWPASTLAVDALVGTSPTGPLRAPFGRYAARLNALGVPVVALDVPSGLDADTGAAPGETVRAALTVTFAAAKPGLYLGEGPAHAGRVVAAEIGLPRGLVDAQLQAHGGAYRSTDRWAAATLPQRASDAQKYSAGMALVVAGSGLYTGAPRLTATAAARAGAGYVRLATAEDAAVTLAGALVEIPVTPLPTAQGGLDPARTLDALGEALDKAKALVVGPGLGRAPGTQRTVRRLLETSDLPAVVDADGLAALDPDWFAAHARGRLVLTPHTGELERLLGHAPDLSDRLGLVRTLAAAWNAVLVLKGLPSVVGTPEGTVYVGGPHSVALATAGTGDVLAGLTGGFLAQGLAPAEAALMALHVGGRAAQHYSRRRAAATMQASDVVTEVPGVLHRLAQRRRDSR